LRTRLPAEPKRNHRQNQTNLAPSAVRCSPCRVLNFSAGCFWEAEPLPAAPPECACDARAMGASPSGGCCCRCGVRPGVPPPEVSPPAAAGGSGDWRDELSPPLSCRCSDGCWLRAPAAAAAAGVAALLLDMRFFACLMSCFSSATALSGCDSKTTYSQWM
jgi:hypothetical protein